MQPSPRVSWPFWFFALTQVLLMMAASAPSPLYPVYQDLYGFSSAVLTIIFAVYVVGMLAMMLTLASISDFIGRRPMMFAGLGLELVALLMFALAGSTGWLIAARTVQGVATALVTATSSAALLDTQRINHPRDAAVATSVAPALGLATGAVLSGIFIEFLPAPTALVYWFLAVCVAACIVMMLRIPETVQPRPGALRSIIPRPSIPPHLRSVMALAVPCFAACWGTGGLYLALGPSMVKSLLHTDNALIGGFAICLLWVPNLIAPFVARSWTFFRMMMTGAWSMLLGTGGLVFAFRAGSFALLFIATIIIGFGFGLLFTAAYGSVAQEIRPGERAQVVATIFIINYLAFSLPVVIAGFLVDRLGLQRASELVSMWIGLMLAIAIAALVVRWRQQRVSVSPPA